jgi:hypothetical protein
MQPSARSWWLPSAARMGFHNAHMLIPRELWLEAKQLAKSRGQTMTRLVVELLSNEVYAPAHWEKNDDDADD